MERKTTPIRKKSPDVAIRDQKIALELFRSNAFLVVNKNLLKAWGPVKTIFLENLIDKYKYWEERGMAQDDGSFFLTHEDQMEQTGLSEHQIRECKRDFVNMGILQTEMKGIPAKEYYSFDFSKLLNIFIQIQENNAPALQFSQGNTFQKLKGNTFQKLKGNTLKNHHLIKDTKDNDNKDKDIYFPQSQIEENIFVPENPDETNSDPTKPTIKEKNLQFLPLASKLAGVIKLSKNIKVPPARLASWAGEIRKLSEMDGIDPARIDAALDWYADNIGGAYVPIIESGYSLRFKFVKLEEAMKRSGYSSASPMPKKVISPKRIIKLHLGGLASSFEKTCYLLAKKLISAQNKAEKAELAKVLIDRFNLINQKWDKLPPEKKTLAELGPITVLQRFIEWLPDQDWISNKDVRVFRNDKIFNSFYGEYLRNIGG